MERGIRNSKVLPVAAIPLFLWSCICLFACQKNESTTVSGRLIHVPGTTRTVYIYRHREPITFWETDKILFDSCKLLADGSYTFNMSLKNQPVFVDIGIADLVFAHNIFIQPRQNLILDYDLAERPPSLLSVATAGIHNRFIQAFSDSFYRKPEVKEYYYVKSNFLLAPDYANYIDKRHKEQKAFLKNHFKDVATDSVFKAYIEAEIDYQWASDKTAFLWKKWIRNEEVPLDSSYFNFLKEIMIDNPEAIISPAYIRFLGLFIRELHRQKPLAEQVNQPNSLLKCKIACEHLRGMALKIALYNILKEEQENAKSIGGNHSQLLPQLQNFAYSVSNDSAFFRIFEKHE